MEIKKKSFGIICSTEDYEKFYNQNKELFVQLSIKFKKIYMINVYNLMFRTQPKIIKNTSILPKNFIIKNFYNSFDFLKFFKKKDFVAIQYLSKNPDFFKIFFLIKLAKIKNIQIMNLGNFGNKITFSFNKKNPFAFKHFYIKGFYYVFRLLNLVNIFPKIDILFESNTAIINSIKNGFSRKFENKFPKLKISYFRKVVKVNSIHYDYFVKSKFTKKKTFSKILFIDVPFDHPDRILREGKANDGDSKIFYTKLKVFLENLSKAYKSKIIIGLHPSTKNKSHFFSSFFISKQKTIDLIKKCEIIVVTHSSLIPLAALYKKKIISINSSLLGDYHNNLIKKYSKNLGLPSFSIDKNVKSLNKKDLSKKFQNSLDQQKKFIKMNIFSGKNETSCGKIIKTIKKHYGFI